MVFDSIVLEIVGLGSVWIMWKDGGFLDRFLEESLKWVVRDWVFRLLMVLRVFVYITFFIGS